MTFVVTGVKKMDDAWLVSVARAWADGTMSTEERLSVSRKGVFRLEYLGNAVDPPNCIIKLPLRIGDNWERKLGKTRARWNVRGVEKVVVPAGIYEAVVIDAECTYGDGSSSQWTCWYAPGIGRVKEWSDGLPPRTEVLASFTPGKK